ncbi:hypothetical protein Trydic_g13882 [Trypoxylus dichotomus]
MRAQSEVNALMESKMLQDRKNYAGKNVALIQKLHLVESPVRDFGENRQSHSYFPFLIINLLDIFKLRVFLRTFSSSLW